MKDNCRSGRPSTKRTDINIKQVMQMVYGDWRLTVQMIASQLDMKKAVFGKLSAKSAQKWCQGCWTMIRKITAYTCVRKSSSVFKLNQTYFVELSMVMRHGFWSRTLKPSARTTSESFQCCWGQRTQVKTKSHFDHVLRCKEHCPKCLFAIGSDDQSASLQGDLVTNAYLSAREETRVVVEQIVAASPRQCTYSQHPKHPAFPS